MGNNSSIPSVNRQQQVQKHHSFHHHHRADKQKAEADTTMDLPESQHTEDITKDVSMIDMNQHTTASSSSSDSKVNTAKKSESSMNLDEVENSDSYSSENPSTASFGAPLRRKSTLILTDDVEYGKIRDVQDQSRDPNLDQDMDADQDQDQDEDEKMADSGVIDERKPRPIDPSQELIPVDLQWRQGGSKVFITGSFTAWRKMIAMNGPLEDGSFTLKLSLPAGTHRFRFIVDNELRFSDFLPTATDQMGNFVNYIEIEPHSKDVDHLNEQLNEVGMEDQKGKKASKSAATIDRLTNDDDDMGGGYSRYHDSEENKAPSPNQYIQSIPPIFTDPKVMEQYYATLDNQQNNNNNQWLIPPQLPPHLESVILNNFNTDKDNNSGSLPIPNHVVLNHLATTSIKHNTLAVASVVRYQRKYATQILYAPLQ